MKKSYKTYQTLDVVQEPMPELISTDYYEMAYADVSKDYIKHVIKKTKIPVKEFIHFLPISIDTYKRKATFNSQVTEKVLQIEEVYSKGLFVFGNSFHTWMETTNVALGNIIPKELLNNSFGIRLLLDEIGRLEHGVLA